MFTNHKMHTIDTHIRAHIHTHTHAHKHTHMHALTRNRTHARVHTHIHSRTCAYPPTCMCTLMCMSGDARIHMSHQHALGAVMHVCIVCVRGHVHMSAYACACSYMRMVHTCTNMQVYANTQTLAAATHTVCSYISIAIGWQ